MTSMTSSMPVAPHVRGAMAALLRAADALDAAAAQVAAPDAAAAMPAHRIPRPVRGAVARIVAVAQASINEEASVIAPHLAVARALLAQATRGAANLCRIYAVGADQQEERMLHLDAVYRVGLAARGRSLEALRHSATAADRRALRLVIAAVDALWRVDDWGRTVGPLSS